MEGDEIINRASILSWIIGNQIKSETGTPIDFKDHMYLVDIYDDPSPKLVCYKAAQIGFSTMAILKSLWMAKQKGLDIIYTMPSASDMKDFVGGKVNRIINQNPILLEYVKDKDSIEQKQVGENIIYYRGTFTEKAAIAVSSDLNIHDEEDRSKQEVIQQYASRLQHSKHKYEWHFSNPSVEGNGVSRYWSRSDQKHWFISCNSCNKEQYLSWPESIDTNKKEFVCKGCGGVLTRDNRRVGRWVSKFKNREYSGYWISLLMAPWITAEEIIKYYETKSKEYFWNFVLGLPYVGEGNSVTPDLIYRNVSSTINSQQQVVIGCDSGLTKHYVVGNKEGIFFYGKTDTWEEIESLMKRFDRSVVIIDNLPDLTGPQKLKEKYPGRVFTAHYSRDRKGDNNVRFGKDKERSTVTIDRNNTIQKIIDEFADRMVPLQGTVDDWNDYVAHWMTLYKVVEVDALGTPVFKWETSTGQDHWVHACFIGDTLVTTEKGGVPIKDIKTGDYVLTRNGFERVSFSGLIKESADVLEATFENGSVLVSTPEHKFWTENSQWKELRNITKNDILVSIWNNDLTEKPTSSTGEKGISLGARAKGYTESFGNTITGLYQKAFMSIIKTIIRLITPLITWSWLNHLNIWLSMLLGKRLKIISVRFAEVNTNAKTQGIINIAQSNVGLKGTGKSISTRWKGNVRSVKNNLPPIHISGQPSVLKTVKVRTIVNGKRKMPVYGITVDGSHEYFANNILVSNSVYWRAGMTKFGETGEIFTPGMSLEGMKSSPEIAPNKTVPAPNPKTLFKFEDKEEELDWRNT